MKNKINKYSTHPRPSAMCFPLSSRREGGSQLADFRVSQKKKKKELQ